MRLVEEEHELRLFQVARFGQLLEQLGQEPQQERRVEPRVLHQFVGGQHIDDAAPVAVGAQEIVEHQRRFAEEFRAALVFEHQKLPLDGADRRLGDVAVLRRQLLGMFGDQAQHGAQILEVDQQQAFFVGDAEGDVEHAFLHLVEVHQPRQQQRPHLRDRGADRMALLAENIPEHGREFVGLILDADLFRARDQEIARLAGRRDAGEIAFDVGGEHRHAGAREAFGQDLQRDGLSGAGGARDKAVPVGHPQREIFGLLTLADKNSI